jgi:hypothetical protein
MTEQLEPVAEPIDHHTPIRASFSMDRGSREAIRWAAERYGVDQSDIVNLAPVLFVILAEGTLNRRRSRLVQLETAARQAATNIGAIEGLAPHLGIFAEALCQTLNALLEGERASIEKAHVSELGYAIIEGDRSKILGQITGEVQDRMHKIYETSPMIEEIMNIAKSVGMIIDQDTQGEDGSARYSYSMILKLGDGRSGNIAVSAHRRNCQIVTTATMDEMLSVRTENGYEPNWVSNFTSLLA